MTQALATIDPAALEACQGMHADVQQLNAALRWAAKTCILVSPAPSAATLPIGHEVAIVQVPIDTREMKHGGNLYWTGGKGEEAKYGLSKAALTRIGRALGVSWDADLTRRTDDGRNPYYCEFRAVGTILDFDGRELTITGTKQMDLSDGSEAIKILEARKRDGGSIEKQLRELRYFIAEHCETKAKLRAIREQGLDTSYTMADLQSKPIMVARVLVTGRVPGNPALEAQLGLLQFAKAVGGTAALFGAAKQIAQAPPPPMMEAAPPPPPESRFDFDAASEPAHKPTPSQAPRAQQPEAKPAAQSGRRTGFKIPGGKEKGKDLAEASDGTLTWWLSKIETDFREDAELRAKGQAGKMKPEFHDYNKKLLEAMKTELARRTGSGQQSLDAAQPQGREPGSDG